MSLKVKESGNCSKNNSSDQHWAPKNDILRGLKKRKGKMAQYGMFRKGQRVDGSEREAGICEILIEKE
jgi:Ni/Co efflux regulator RcnB